MDVARERLLARHAICSFYELDEDPRSVWVDDDRVARVRLVRSKYRHSSRVLSSLAAAFKLGARLLPNETELDKVESRVSS